MKNPIGFEPVNIPRDLLNDLDMTVCYTSFMEAVSADHQLSVLKNIVTDTNNLEDNIKFLVIVFLQTEAKHPIKNFITRFVTKNSHIQEMFSKALMLKISSLIDKNVVNHRTCKDVVMKLASCIENFPAGATAIRMLEMPLIYYLKECLKCCVKLLSENALSPTEKTELFNLSHLTLRLLLHIIQKCSQKTPVTDIFQELKKSVKYILFDVDTPMDTKSVCGMLIVAIHVLENGADSWIDILSSQEKEEELKDMLENDSAKLSLYSAIVTVVPVHKLYTKHVDEEVAVLMLIKKILVTGERMCSDSTFTLGVTRSLVHISKSLDKSGEIGIKAMDRLLVFMWSHLEHYMDSVRHLTAQMLNNIIKYSALLKRQGNESAVSNIITSLNSLDRHRKSFYLTLTSLANELGALYLLNVLPNIINDVICALHVQAVQASATTFLEVLLQKQIKESSSQVIYENWVCPILLHVRTNSLDSALMNILEGLLALAIKLDEQIMDYVLPYISESCANIKRSELKCVLMLLSVVRRSRRQMFSDVIGYHVLEAAAVDLVDETRILSLALIIESTKTTEIFSQKDLDFVLFFLKYNCNAQEPHFRQLMLSMIKKFIKRFEDSYKVLKRNNTEPSRYYLEFVEKLRELCYSSLLRGANYSRRIVSLQILDWIEHIALDEYERSWKEEYIDRLLVHLEDSYENNKMFALSILQLCPAEMLQKNTYSISLKLEKILSEASSVKPTCTCAAYKLLVLKSCCASYVVSLNKGETDRPEEVTYILLKFLLTQLEKELAVCQRSVLHSAKDAPMYGLVHCMRYLLEIIDPCVISCDSNWTELISRIISVCLDVNRAVACVVNNSSPEGHLPMDMNGVTNEVSNSNNVCLQDGRPVTAQMVLLCAWRSVKEVSLLLGIISSRLAIEGEGEKKGSVSREIICEVGDHFTTLLAETKHRGAFEQAYVGFTKLLARLWRCQNPQLHELPKRWLDDLLQVIQSGDNEKLCATRRSAGLPYMIQALVITELQVTGNPKCFTQCMRTLLHIAKNSNSVEARTHCTNILRALYRNTNLDDVVAGYVGEGLLLALNGFEGNTWQERNSSTLLFSALMVRIFGVTRGKDPDTLCTRNRMTGRIFFLRYPALADFMLNKLSEANESEKLLRPSVYPVLLILARLYPSALEGTVSNIKLVSFIPSVLSCASNPVLKTRQLAAKAMVPLVSPHMYIQHIQAMFKLIGDRHIKRNYCHGVILQVIKLLEAKPEDLQDDYSATSLNESLLDTKWIIEQTLTNIPCYLLTDDYVKMVDLIVNRFPVSVHSNLLREIKPLLNQILFEDSSSILKSGKEVCLANIVKLYLSILNSQKNIDETCEFIKKCLKHNVYEVVLVILNHLLAIYTESSETKLQIILDSMQLLRRDYIQLLCKLLDNPYLECTQKALQLLVLEENTQETIIRAKLKKDDIGDNETIYLLIHLLENEHENFTQHYLRSLTTFVSRMLVELSFTGTSILQAIRVMFACSFSHNGDTTRKIVVEFLEVSLERLLTLDIDLDDDEQFEYNATIWSIVAILLEDDEKTIRNSMSCIITDLYNKQRSKNNELGQVIPSKAMEYLVEFVGSCPSGQAILCVLALLDFKSEVCMNDEVNDECRVFDTNERHNIFSEEVILTATCVRALRQEFDMSEKDVQIIISNPIYKRTFNSLCDQNLPFDVNSHFKSKNANPKFDIFHNILST
ncbi:unnamed protein product [Leptosia nina]|uniref:tRNA (32-2'-O)-methyltransferase regulator THADA n=1 Tax=Leptosia nina TaxID=320188 RepID=A0AAV1J4Y8_9NEOP